MARAIPVATGHSRFHPPLGELVIEVFAVTADGRVVKDLGRYPVVAGVATYDGPPEPPDPALRWAIRIREDATAVAVFRSGPLGGLPGAGRTRLLDTRIALYRCGGRLGLDSPDGASSLLRARIAERLPPAIDLDDVLLTAGPEGRYVVTLRGRVRVAGLGLRFRYGRPLHLSGSRDPGRPGRVAVAWPGGPAEFDGRALALVRRELDEVLAESVEDQLAASMRHVAVLAMTVEDAGFEASTVTLGTIRLDPPGSTPDVGASVELCGGAVVGSVVLPDIEPVVLG